MFHSLLLIILFASVSVEQLNNLHLRVVTIEQPPFVFYPPANSTQEYRGFFIDILKEAVSRLGTNISFTLTPVPDGSFGAPRTMRLSNGTTVTQWNGVVGELMAGKFDLFAGPLTITSLRKQVIDFTASYLNVGLRVTIPREKSSHSNNPFTFLFSFTPELWVLLLFTPMVIGLVSFVLDKMSPDGYAQTYKGDEDKENTFSVGSAIENTWISMLRQGGNPSRNWSTRALLLSYFFFTLLIYSIYGANLSTFMLAQRRESRISSVEDLRTANVPFAVVANSAISSFFLTNKQVEYQVMVRNMRQYPTISEAMAALRNKSVNAVIHSNIITDYLAAQQPCDVVQVGDLLNNAQYGIAVPKNSFLFFELSKVMLKLNEDGFIEGKTKEWYKSECPEDGESTPEEAVTLAQMAGLFYLMFILIGLSLLTLSLEVMVHKFFPASRWLGHPKNVPRKKSLFPTQQTPNSPQNTANSIANQQL